MPQKESSNVAMLVVLGLLISLFLIKYHESQKAEINPTPSAQQSIPIQPTAQQCNVDSTTTILGPVQEFYSGQSLPLLYDRLYIFNAQSNEWTDLGSYPDGTSKVLAPGNRIRVLYNWNGSSTSPYSALTTFTLPCIGGTSTSTLDEGKYRLYNKSTISQIQATVYNANGSTNDATNPQPLRNQTLNLRFNVVFPAKAAFGGADGVVQICQYNSTTIKMLSLASGMPEAPIPRRITQIADLRMIAWEYPGQLANGKISDSFIIESSTTTGNSNSMNCTLVDKAYFIANAGSTEPQLGYEDSLHNDIGSNDFSYIVNMTG